MELLGVRSRDDRSGRLGRRSDGLDGGEGRGGGEVRGGRWRLGGDRPRAALAGTSGPGALGGWPRRANRRGHWQNGRLLLDSLTGGSARDLGSRGEGLGRVGRSRLGRRGRLGGRGLGRFGLGLLPGQIFGRGGGRGADRGGGVGCAGIPPILDARVRIGRDLRQTGGGSGGGPPGGGIALSDRRRSLFTA